MNKETIIVSFTMDLQWYSGKQKLVLAQAQSSWIRVCMMKVITETLHEHYSLRLVACFNCSQTKQNVLLYLSTLVIDLKLHIIQIDDNN